MKELPSGELNPQTPEDKIKLFESMCRGYREGTEEFFALYQEFIKNLHSYPEGLSQRFAEAIDSINKNLFFAFLTAEHSDKLSLYLYFASRKDKNDRNNSRALQLLNRIINNFQSSNFTHQQCLQLMQAVIQYNPERREALQRLISQESLVEAEDVAEKQRKRKIQRLEKYYRLNLAGKSYFSAERRAVRRLIFALGKGRFQEYRQRLLADALNGKDVETAKLINQILPHLPVKSNDGKRTYWLNLEETEAVVIIPELGTPDPDKKFHVQQVPADEIERGKTFKDAKVIREYFHHDIAGDFVISDYVPEKDWSEYGGRVAPKNLTVVERLASLCEKLRNVAERKPPIDSEGRSYFWTRRELHQMDDSRENINLLVPVIRHYLGVSDPLCNTNFDAVMRLGGAVGIDNELRKIIGHFLARMLGETNKRPDIKEVVEFFECAKRYQENNSEEEMEVLKLMGNSRDFEGDYGLPKFSKARWLWFVELSDPKKHEIDRLSWGRLAQAIADKKEDYTFEQRQFLRRKLREYGKAIEAAGSLFDEDPRDLFPVGEEKEALINLMEEIKADNKLEIIKDKILLLGFDVSKELLDELWRIIQIAEENPTINFNVPLVRKMLMRLENPPANILVILSTPADKRTAEQYEQLNEYSRDEENVLRNASIYEDVQKAALTNEIALQIFCANDLSAEQQKYMAKYIAERIFEYSGEEVVQFFNKLKEYKLDEPLAASIRKRRGIRRIAPAKLDETQVKIKESRDRIVEALKAYRNSLFYFNPKRLDISHVINILKDPSLQREEAVLIEPEYASILNNVLRLIPLNELQAFRRSTKPFRKYKQYELVRTPNGSVFAIDHAQCLGSGAYGSVFVAYEVNQINGKLGKRVAAKFFNKENSHAQIVGEAKALEKSFDVRGVVSDKVQTCLVMEYVKGKPIAKESWSDGTFTNPADISTLPLAERFKAIVMLIAEVSTAHQHRNSGNAFLHRDIRLENVHVEIDNGKVKDVRLLDFGLAAFISQFYEPKSANFAADNAVGARGFIAPEQVKNLKSDMRSLLPTILPLLGVYRLYHSHDIDEHHTVKHYLLSGLLRGMENELPLPLRAALFQFILKMESYDDPNVRPSDDEAFRFFNALYNYCRATDKSAWYEIEYHQELLKNYGEILPNNYFRWFQQLNEQENPSPAVREEIQRMKEKVFQQIEAFHRPEISEDEKRTLGTYFDHLSTGVISAKIRLLRYFLFDEENENENKLRWEFLVKALSAAQLETESFCAFMCLLNAKRKLIPDIVFKNENNTVLELDKEVLEKFVFLSKTKNYKYNQASWKILADIVVENLDKYSGADLLTILRKINKFNVDGAYDNFRDAVKEKLNSQWTVACDAVIEELHISKTGISWNRSAVNDLKLAIDGQCFWSRNNRKYLKNAVSESPNKAVSAVVRKLGKVVDVGA